MGLFGTTKASKGSIDEVAGMIQSYFRKRQLDPATQELAAAEGYGWWLKEGSAKIYLFVQDTQHGPVLRITSPLVYIPDQNREAFYRRLLDINRELISCSLCTHENFVLVVAQRHTIGLDQQELDDLAWNVAYVADWLDNKLSSEFNARMYSTDHTA